MKLLSWLKERWEATPLIAFNKTGHALVEDGLLIVLILLVLLLVHLRV